MARRACESFASNASTGLGSPEPVDRLTVAYERVWDAFRRSQLTADGRHDTPYWRAQGGPYAACVVRVPAEALQPQLTQLRARLAGLPGVRLHPDHFLHIMLQELGFVVETSRKHDEISAARLEEFAQSIVEPVSSTRPLAVRLGGANSFQDAVFLDVQGGGPLSRLHERLFDLAALPTLPNRITAHAAARVGHRLGRRETRRP